jgi:hypothetical protein
MVLWLGSSGCALLLVGAAGGAAGAAASAKESRHESHSPITYAGAVIANCFYVPAKVVFALLGGITSGAAYVVTVGDREATNGIWQASTGGTYVLTPSMLDGHVPVRFVGP